MIVPVLTSRFLAVLPHCAQVRCPALNPASCQLSGHQPNNRPVIMTPVQHSTQCHVHCPTLSLPSFSLSSTHPCYAFGYLFGCVFGLQYDSGMVSRCHGVRRCHVLLAETQSPWLPTCLPACLPASRAMTSILKPGGKLGTISCFVFHFLVNGNFF